MASSINDCNGLVKSPAVLAFTNRYTDIFFSSFLSSLLRIRILFGFSVDVLISAPFLQSTTHWVGVSECRWNCNLTTQRSCTCKKDGKS